MMTRGLGISGALTLVALVIVESCACPPAQAAEGASSNYTPGTYGNLGVALQPKPGSFGVINYLGYVSSTTDRAVLIVDMKKDWKVIYPFEKQ